MDPERRRVAAEIARDDADGLRSRALRDQLRDATGRASHLGLRTARRNAARRGVRWWWRWRDGARSGDLGPTLEAAAKVCCEDLNGSASGRVGGFIDQHACAVQAEQDRDEIAGATGRIREAVHEDGARREVRGILRQQLRRAGEGVRAARQIAVLQLPHSTRRDPDDGSCDLTRRSRRGELSQPLVDRLGVVKLEPGIQQIRHTRFDRPVAVHQSIQSLAQHRLATRELAHEERHQARTAPSRFAGPLQHPQRQAAQGDDREARNGSPASLDHAGRQVGAQTRGRHRDDHRQRKQGGIGADGVELFLESDQQSLLRGAGSVKNLDPTARSPTAAPQARLGPRRIVRQVHQNSSSP